MQTGDNRTEERWHRRGVQRTDRPNGGQTEGAAAADSEVPGPALPSAAAGAARGVPNGAQEVNGKTHYSCFSLFADISKANTGNLKILCGGR